MTKLWKVLSNPRIPALVMAVTPFLTLSPTYRVTKNHQRKPKRAQEVYISFFKDKENATSVHGGEILCLQEQNATTVVDRREQIRKLLRDMTKYSITSCT